MQPLVTLIIATLNAEETLQNCINSFLSQNYINKELIIIDAGSTDNTLNIIKNNNNHISYWVSEPDSGIYDAWNKGLLSSKGDWICFLGSDDYFWADNVIEEAINAIYSEEKECRLAYGSIAILNENMKCLYTVGEPWESARVKLSYAMSVPHPGMFHHKSWFEKYGFFDISYRIAGDYEMILRGYRQEHIFYIPKLITVGMSLGGVSSTPKNSILQLKEVWRAQKKHGRNYPHWKYFLAVFRVYLRLTLELFLTQRVTFFLLDFGRKLSGKPPHWTKL